MNIKDKWLEEARQLEYEWSNNPRCALWITSIYFI